MSARKVTPEISGEELALAAEQALERDLSKERKRRLVALCGMSAEWSDEELSFSFTHLAIAEHFLARQITRVPLQQALSLLCSVAVSSLCAQLIHSMWPKNRAETIEIVIAELQARVTAAESPEHCRSAMASLGELWARVAGTAEGHGLRVGSLSIDSNFVHLAGSHSTRRRSGAWSSVQASLCD